ncbi:helix-turn-helix transcriptional regulator [Nocardia yamanashiensis]|uniref:helix-turn-helix domain-containing protein n=1 Tax=Nocardia yamanashiensis TaxID=209247 RepID=UPI001E5A9708|nr:helix-turn-helix domain-containing protein [Nocardia yamanashiensis]UGT41236.1 helix-turn-helix transcriptional regulator [Nocardia yamanashiensis]
MIDKQYVPGRRRILRPPSFGESLRRLRDERNVSREKLAMSIGVSVSYVARLESGARSNPGPDVLRVVIDRLDRIAPISAVRRRHLHELAGVPLSRTAPAVAELRAEITPDMRALLAAAEPNPACYYDIRYHVLAGNETFFEVMPGLARDGNIARWYFADPIAKQALAEWDYEASMMAAGLRLTIGRSDSPESFTELLTELYDFPEFRGKWEDESFYDRNRRPILYRDPDTGERIAAEVHGFVHESAAHPGWIWLYLGRRAPAPEAC